MSRTCFTLSLLFITINLLGQKPGLVKFPIPQRNQDFNVTVEYQNDFLEHCSTPLIYTIRKSGTFTQDTKLQWTYQYIPCNGTRPITETAILLVPKGSTTLIKPIQVKTRNLISIYDDGSFKVIPVTYPEFTVSGPAEAIMEGDEFTLQVHATNADRIKWIWSKGTSKNIMSGKNENILAQTTNNTTTYYVCAEKEGFRSPVQSVIVNVIKRPDPPNNFVIKGPAMITDIETAELSINSDTELEGLQWIWESRGEILHKGKSITVDPKTTTRYTVHGEYFGKKSIYKTHQINVHVLKPAPEKFLIDAPKEITDGQTATLTVYDPESTDSVTWIWTDMTTRQMLLGEKINTKPTQTTTYQLQANRSGKLSKKIVHTVTVIQEAIAPIVTGNFKRCINSEIESRFILEGGRLGTNSRNWKWYEGICGSGRLIHTGNVLAVAPKKTTSYYVQPDNNSSVCKAFTVEVGNVPDLPNTITAPQLVCAGNFITIEAVGTKASGVQWNWYASEQTYSLGNYKAEGSQIQTQVNRSTTFTLVARNEYCESDKKQVTVKVKEQSELPATIYVVQKKRRKYTATVLNVKLMAGSRLAWYRRSCENGEVLAGNKTEITFRARNKTNKLFVRAEGACDTSKCASAIFNYTKPRDKFIFVNFGLSSNKKRILLPITMRNLCWDQTGCT